MASGLCLPQWVVLTPVYVADTSRKPTVKGQRDKQSSSGNALDKLRGLSSSYLFLQILYSSIYKVLLYFIETKYQRKHISYFF